MKLFLKPCAQTGLGYRPPKCQDRLFRVLRGNQAGSGALEVPMALQITEDVRNRDVTKPPSLAFTFI